MSPEGVRGVCRLADGREAGRCVSYPSSDGVEYTARGVYREIVEGERLIYDDFCDEDGKLFHQAL